MLQDDLPDTVATAIKSSVQNAFLVSESPDISELDIETEVELFGPLDAVTSQNIQICGLNFSLDSSSKIEGNPQPGEMVKVDFVNIAGNHVATKFEQASTSIVCELRMEGILDL